MVYQAAKDWDAFDFLSFTLDFVKHLSHTSLVLATDVLEMMMERQERMETDETDQANNA